MDELKYERPARHDSLSTWQEVFSNNTVGMFRY